MLGLVQGLACLFANVVLIYTGIVLVIWLALGVAVALARRRWESSEWRLLALRVLAGLSWIPLAALVVLAFDI